MPPTRPHASDTAIIGAGAAGLATAIFTRRLNPARSVRLFDGAKKPGAKILMSGGSRCNVTNASVTHADFWGGKSSLIGRVLRAFPVSETIAFFRQIGVPMHEEAGGKFFPDSNHARDVLEALLRDLDASGAELRAGHRVLDVVRAGASFRIATSRGEFEADTVVLATGGRSIPRTGSDGAGFEIARRLGHTLTPLTPGLTPLLLSKGDELHNELSGVSQDVELALWVDRSIAHRIRGAMLWTHFGISGPAALDMSRHWLRATIEARAVRLTANFCPSWDFESLDRWWTRRAEERPKSTIRSVLAAFVPASVAAALLRQLHIDATLTLAYLSRVERRRLTLALVAWPLPVVDSRGYRYAEVTAGGVPLTEIDVATMESRVCPGLYFVGEILDVDGRVGGFNFQWAWSSAYVAATAIAERRTEGSPGSVRVHE